MANDSLLSAKKAKNDEFYTVFEYVQKEINAYLEYDPYVFKGKTILLPCDDPEWSNFTRFFAQNFEALGLKKLISTSYSFDSKKSQYEQYHQLTLFEMTSPQYDEKKSHAQGKIYTLTKDINKSGNVDINDLEWRYLEGDGDFRSNEVRALRDEADIIVTNPPFSLFREFVDWIFEADKKCIIIGTIGAASYKEIFPLIKDNKLWIGATNNGKDMVFEVPEGAKVDPKDKLKAEKLGYVGNYTRLGNACWYTNVDHGRRHLPLSLMTMSDNLKFSKHKEILENGYIKYENFDAIEVPYVDAIPSDYEGAMGVPSSFLDKYNPDQFEILGLAHGNLGVELGIRPYDRKLKKINKGLRDGDFYYFKDGKPQIPYSRIVIKKKVSK
ncbi:adenine-specific methyltransferase EcoRI family protein [Proteiniclasticum sp. C24MP]|uniref:adenine-specific methyltransferase EcoRI family protein n=1 Tax=Proteiniclasticum sp. C24MP TaxID=3374101 RepID=UPI003755004F